MGGSVESEQLRYPHSAWRLEAPLRYLLDYVCV